MKRILFVMPSYELGGISSSLSSLLSMIDPKRLRVDVFASPHGSYKGRMPNCRELPQNIWLSYPYLGGNVFIKIFQTIVYGLRYALSKIHVDTFPLIYWIGGKSIGSDKYDAVVCFCEGQASSVCYYPAKRRIQWIHCDYRRCGAASDGDGQIKVYRKIDTIVCVSEFVRDVFSGIFPEFANKTLAIHNIINVEDLIKKAAAPIEDDRFDTNGFTIVSCGRLDSVKQFHLIPGIAAKVKGLTDKPFHWYIIGGGDDSVQKDIESGIDANGVREDVVLLGMQTNPYSYMAKADLYVCTSSSESYPMVVHEAKALGVPVVGSDFPSARESVTEGVDGFIVSVDNMACKIVEIMGGNVRFQHTEPQNDQILKQIYNLFE